METARFSETLASTNQSKWRLNPKVYHQNNHPSVDVRIVDCEAGWALGGYKRQFSPEESGSISLRKVGICLQIYKAPQLVTPTSVCWPQ
jgi:hypothetical protein